MSTQYTTIVAQGGTPIRIADQSGAPYPTTGTGALVFADGPTITDAVLINPSTINPNAIVNRTTAITYYVATTGSDANVGTANSPVLTFQKALDLCAATATYSSGPFVIEAAAGTYTAPARLTYTASLFTASPVTFKGHVTGGIPDTIIQGSADGTRTHNFLDANGPGLVFIFQDIWFRSFVQVSAATQHGRSVMTRCWAKNCFNVLACSLHGIAAAFGGDWDGRDLDGVMVEDGAGFLSVIVAAYNLRQSDYTAGLLIHHRHCAGALIDECGSGHMDWLRIEDCTIGVELIRSTGGPNMGFTRIWRCATGILNGAMTQLLIAPTQDFGQGTANACTTNVVTSAAPVYQQQTETNYSTRLEFLAFSLTNSSNLTGSIAERDVWNPLINITRGRVRDRDTLDIHMFCHGILTVAGTLRLYFGATLMKAWTLPVGMTDARIEIMLEALNGTDWRGQIYQSAGPAATPAPSLVQIVTVTGLTSLTVDTELRLTWQAGATIDFFQMNVGRLYSSVSGLGFA